MLLLIRIFWALIVILFNDLFFCVIVLLTVPDYLRDSPSPRFFNILKYCFKIKQTYLIFSIMICEDKYITSFSYHLINCIAKFLIFVLSFHGSLIYIYYHISIWKHSKLTVTIFFIIIYRLKSKFKFFIITRKTTVRRLILYIPLLFFIL